MIHYIQKTIINLAKLMPDSIKMPILNIFVKIRMRFYGFSMKKKGNHYSLIDHKKNINVSFYVKPHIFDIYVVIGYLKMYTPKIGDIIIDGGGFHGIVGLYIAKIIGPTGKVFIFEPDPINFHELEKNIALNELTNVVALQKGMRSKNMSMDFIIQGQASSLFIEKKVKGRENICKIELVNPIVELQKHGINRINFVKMDIEGAEIEVVKGMENYLKTHNVNFAIASYHILPGEKEKTCKELERIFHKIGYQYTTGFDGHLTTYAAKKN